MEKQLLDADGRLTEEGREEVFSRIDTDPAVQQEILDFKIRHLNRATNPDEIAERHSRIMLLQGYVDIDEV